MTPDHKHRLWTQCWAMKLQLDNSLEFLANLNERNTLDAEVFRKFTTMQLDLKELLDMLRDEYPQEKK